MSDLEIIKNDLQDPDKKHFWDTMSALRETFDERGWKAVLAYRAGIHYGYDQALEDKYAVVHDSVLLAYLIGAGFHDEAKEIWDEVRPVLISVISEFLVQFIKAALLGLMKK